MIAETRTNCPPLTLPAQINSYYLFVLTQDKLGPIENCQSTWHALLCSKCHIPAGQPGQLLLKSCFCAEG